jgi:hypothetical protein
MYPACSHTTGILLRGTLDGMPYDKEFPTTGQGANPTFKPYTAGVYFDPVGEIKLAWTGTPDNDKPHPATGTLSFTSETTKREVKVGSTIVFSHTGAFLMDLLLDNGELLGCANN